jgi:hypothetical protein
VGQRGDDSIPAKDDQLSVPLHRHEQCCESQERDSSEQKPQASLQLAQDSQVLLYQGHVGLPQCRSMHGGTELGHDVAIDLDECLHGDDTPMERCLCGRRGGKPTHVYALTRFTLRGYFNRVLQICSQNTARAPVSALWLWRGHCVPTCCGSFMSTARQVSGPWGLVLEQHFGEEVAPGENDPVDFFLHSKDQLSPPCIALEHNRPPSSRPETMPP